MNVAFVVVVVVIIVVVMDDDIVVVVVVIVDPRNLPLKYSHVYINSNFCYVRLSRVVVELGL